MRASFRVAIALLVAVFVASACGGASTGGAAAKPTIKIGSTNFYEQGILAEVYAQALENSGYTVERKLNLGNREIVQPALESGQIDIDAEYLATLLVFLDKNAKASTDPKETAKTLQTVLSTKKLTVLDAAAATDQNGFVVTKDTAAKFNLKKLSDLAAVGAQLILGGPAECPSRPFCQQGLKSTYNITFKDFKPLDAGGPLTVAALDGKQIDVGLLFTSDPTIVAKSFVLLEDDKHLQLSDNIAPVVRDDLLAKDDGTIRKVLNSISAKLTQDELNGMNKLVSVDKKDPKDVAKEWLKKQGLIK
ncbi:MAG: ABC transporter substrate-binding protein [Chloroflexota bacterium]|nr:ABC transporter substrate-binding protein [Chloroflexota bacterium]